MAVVTIREFEKILTGLIGDSINQKAMKAFGEAARDLIVARTRRGFGVEKTGANQQRLKPLSQSYIKQRQRSSLDPTTSARKSNLTFSGQLLRSIVVKAGRGKVSIQPNNRRRRTRLPHRPSGHARLVVRYRNTKPAR